MLIRAGKRFAINNNRAVSFIVQNWLAMLLLFALLNGFMYQFTKKYTIGVGLSPSLDQNVFLFKKGLDRELKNGDVIKFKMTKQTPYSPTKDIDYAKEIKCLPGDTLVTKGLEYYCNDQLLGRAKTIDSQGRPVTTFFQYGGVVPNDSYFVMGTHKDSHDSRYWGFVDKKEITGVMVWGI